MLVEVDDLLPIINGAAHFSPKAHGRFVHGLPLNLTSMLDGAQRRHRIKVALYRILFVFHHLLSENGLPSLKRLQSFDVIWPLRGFLKRGLRVDFHLVRVVVAGRFWLVFKSVVFERRLLGLIYDLWSVGRRFF